jgi:uncharacterized membrane protein YkvA (DUF1232 family)
MNVKGWDNGSPNDITGAGYGIQISKKERDNYSKKSWNAVTIELDDGSIVNVNLTKTFWQDCTELHSSKIGKWMLDKKVAPWKENTPPNLSLEPVKDRKFKLSIITDFSKEYSEHSFWGKIKKFAKQAGREFILMALTLYYCAIDPDTPKWAKVIIIGALGYFIAVLDAIPDFTPIIGLTDDFGALSVAIATVTAHIKPEHRQRAEQTLKILFK